MHVEGGGHEKENKTLTPQEAANIHFHPRLCCGRVSDGGRKEAARTAGCPGMRDSPRQQPQGLSRLRPGELQDPFPRKSVRGAFWQDLVREVPLSSHFTGEETESEEVSKWSKAPGMVKPANPLCPVSRC